MISYTYTLYKSELTSDTYFQLEGRDEDNTLVYRQSLPIDDKQMGLLLQKIKNLLQTN